MWSDYSVKTLFKLSAVGIPKHKDGEFTKDSVLFEERIVLLKARSFDEAIKKGEEEALLYVSQYNNFNRKNKYDQSLKKEFLNACDAFLVLSPNKKSSITEVYCNTFIFDNEFDENFIDMQLGLPDDSTKNKFISKEYYEKHWKEQ